MEKIKNELAIIGVKCLAAALSAVVVALAGHMVGKITSSIGPLPSRHGVSAGGNVKCIVDD